MPVSILEGDKFGAADASDWFAACKAPLREKLTETIGAVWFIVATREAGTCQTGLAVRTGETFSVPWFVLIRNTATCNHLQKRYNFRVGCES